MKWLKETVRARNVLLKTHYAQFDSLPLYGPEWNKLARSGRAWDNIYQLRDAEPWREAQNAMRRELAHLDILRRKFQLSAEDKSPSRVLQDTTSFCSKLLANFS
jgi:hypothetical protein